MVCGSDTPMREKERETHTQGEGRSQRELGQRSRKEKRQPFLYDSPGTLERGTQFDFLSYDWREMSYSSSMSPSIGPLER